MSMVYHSNNLGVTYTKEKSIFRLWSPNAKSVHVYLYDKSYKNKAYEKIELEKAENGTWVCEVEEDLNGVYYTYEIEYENQTYELVDPYAKACGVNGERGMIVNLRETDPEGWAEDRRPPLKSALDTILYEAHLRDFTIHKSSGIVNAGKFLGLTEKNTKSREGLATGIDHLVELGITHLHLLPVTDFDGINEHKLTKAQYNWGYRPINFFCLEGSYSTNPLDGATRIKEFKALVQTLHRHGIRVSVDLVFHHHGNLDTSNLHKSNPGYYYQPPYQENVYPLDTEKPMARQFIIDVITYLAEEYHLDGFGIDNLWALDVETVNAIRQALDRIDPTILLFGNTLIDSSKQYTSQRFMHLDVQRSPRVAIYNHDARDGIKGPYSYPEQPGFVNGGVDMESTIRLMMAGGIEHPEVDFEDTLYSKQPWATQPNQVINYVARHNDFTLYDKILETTEGLDQAVRMKMVRMAAVLLFTAQGIPMLQAGDEMLRSKSGDKYSGESPDFINQIVWNSKYDHENLFEYVKGLIRLRKAHPAFRMNRAESIREHLTFLSTPVSNTLAVHLKNNANGDSFTDIVLLFNANTSEVRFKLPHFGVWNVIVDGERAGVEVVQSFINDSVVLPELTAMVLYSNEKRMKEVTVVEKDRPSTTKKLAYVAGAIGLYLLLRRRRRRKE